VPHQTLFYRFGVALFIGLLVGLQREFSIEDKDKPGTESFAGVRTFTFNAVELRNPFIREMIFF